MVSVLWCKWIDHLNGAHHTKILMWKNVPYFFCTACSFTQYMENVVRKGKPDFGVTDNSIAYVGNPTNTARKAWIKSSEDPRSYSSFNKQCMLGSSSSTPGVEARATAGKNNMRIEEYVETLPKENNSKGNSSKKNSKLVTSRELKEVD